MLLAALSGENFENRLNSNNVSLSFHLEVFVNMPVRRDLSYIMVTLIFGFNRPLALLEMSLDRTAFYSAFKRLD